MNRKELATGFRFISILRFVMIAFVMIAGFAGAQEEPAPAEKSVGLIDIARIESRREKEILDHKISEIILQLGIYTDPKLAFVQQKQEEILSYGNYAIPLLLKAMDVESTEKTRINAGRMAAAILARIEDPQVEKEVLILLNSDKDRTKANAILCLGEMGLSTHLDKIKPHLQSENTTIKKEALLCLGKMKSEDLLSLTQPFIAGDDPDLQEAAIHALDLWGEGGQGACTQVLQALSSTQKSSVKETALAYLQKHGGPECVPMLMEQYRGPGMKQRQRHLVLATLTTLGRTAEASVRKNIIDFMKKLLAEESYETVKKAAFHLNELGDDSGVKVLTENYDRLIDKHGNAEYFFYRGEILLQFKKYKESRRDYQEGLRKDKKAGRYGLQKVYLSLARCYAGEERFKEAERNLRKAQLKDTTGLPKQYEEFAKMAEDERYAKVFQPGFK